MPSEFAADLPQIRKQWLEEGISQIRRTSRSACSHLCSNRAFHHLHVSVAPFLDSLVEIYESLAECSQKWVGVIDPDQFLLQVF